MNARPDPEALHLDLLPLPVALCQLPASSPIPEWVHAATQFMSVSRTPTELSIVADERAVPDSVVAERGYHALRVKGPMPLDVVGVMSAVAAPLARARVPIFAIATVDTDYVMVHDRDLARAIEALESSGHTVHRLSLTE